VLKKLGLFLVSLLVASVAFGQNVGTLRGVVSDESGAVIPGAKVTATGPRGLVRTATAGPDGTYTYTGLPAGRYSVAAAAPGLAQFKPGTVDIGAGSMTLNIQLQVAAETQQVTVQETATPTVSTDPANNAGQLVLKEEDLQALSDDPDDLQQDLQALAGPSAGPNGGQIYIDGFSDGRMPPKESIREVRINSNPFSAEYDQLGFGRIEIFTKPGMDKLRGTAFFNISDGALNSRNPYLESPVTPPFMTRQYGGNVGGPISKKASFFLDFERREIDDDSIVNAQIVNSSTFQIQPYSTFVKAPQHRTTVSPRIDYQLSAKQTLTVRYAYLLNNQTNQGVGNFSLASLGYNAQLKQSMAQVTDTIIVNSSMINEVRFQYHRDDSTDFGNNSVPALVVPSAFNGGGAQVGLSYDKTDHYELQNYTSFNHGKMSWKWGIRVRATDDNNRSPQNFGGTFTFAGATGPQLDSDGNPIPGSSIAISPIQQYQRTLMFQAQGLSAAQIRLLGGEPSQFTLAAGSPFIEVDQTDIGLFVQNDWRLKPNLTLSLGLRYERQTNIHDNKDFGPRLGFAWAPGSTKNLRPKTVFRGGFGMFYTRLNDNYVINSERYNGVTQRQYIASNPNFFPNIPSLSELQQQSTAITQIDPTLRAPYIMQSAISVERQLPLSSTLAVTYTNSRGVHLFNSRDINAPLPGTFTPGVPGSGVFPYAGTTYNGVPIGTGQLDQYESDGVFRQNQLIFNLTTRTTRNLSIFTGYVLNSAHSDTDSINTFPANQYNMAAQYGRSTLDVRSRFWLGGSYAWKWNVRLSPFITARSGAPFNIYESQDLYGDQLLSVSRPAYATNSSGPNVVQTPYGLLDLNPQPGEKLIPRNLGNGPAFFSFNLRLSKTIGFGGERSTPRPNTPQGGGGPQMGGFGGGPGRGGGGGGMRGGGGGGGRGGGGDALTSRRYNLILGVQARNLFNTNNEGPIIGNISSPLFGTSNQLAGGFGAVNNPANNRRIEFQVRFMF
jgi:hypothetical protein